MAEHVRIRQGQNRCRHHRSVEVGEDPFRIHSLWWKMFVKSMRWGLVGPTISILGAIEIALWDMPGKAVKLPVYQLLGGLAHKSPRCYTSLAKPDAKLADSLPALGYSALKVAHSGVWPRPDISACRP